MYVNRLFLGSEGAEAAFVETGPTAINTTRRLTAPHRIGMIWPRWRESGAHWVTSENTRCAR